MWENIIEPEKSKRGISQQACAFLCWINKATNTHPVYVILIAFPRQHELLERASLLHYNSFPILLWNHVASAEVQSAGQRPRLYSDLLAPQRVSTTSRSP